MSKDVGSRRYFAYCDSGHTVVATVWADSPEEARRKIDKNLNRDGTVSALKARWRDQGSQVEEFLPRRRT